MGIMDEEDAEYWFTDEGISYRWTYKDKEYRDRTDELLWDMIRDQDNEQVEEEFCQWLSREWAPSDLLYHMICSSIAPENMLGRLRRDFVKECHKDRRLLERCGAEYEVI